MLLQDLTYLKIIIIFTSFKTSLTMNPTYKDDIDDEKIILKDDKYVSL